ncbi:PEP-CTERM sorting domain-containing protein [Thalassotalea atypica]|uniref:PEP-CTERM sorting domain-containing protein n=1 Tax=Thalassotalea atypica TaxID=2054316 RepID=UPI00257352A4|nr:PEP-CTERM sorting domain-containing protein [Thalassotalea atypica]
MKILCTFFTILILLISTPSHGALIKSDYLNAGDGLLLQDTNQGLEWLNLLQTYDMTYAEAVANFAGFRVATQAEVENMFFDVIPIMDGQFTRGTVHGSYDSSHVDLVTQAESYTDLFGFVSISTERRTYGNYIGDNGGYFMAGIRTNPDGQNGVSRVFLNYRSTCTLASVPNASDCAWNGSSAFGVYLVRAADGIPVPEPSTLAIFALGLFGLTLPRLKMKKIKLLASYS